MSDDPSERVDRPRLLYLGHNLPFPPHEGALIRSYHTVRLLSKAFDLFGIYFFRRGAQPSRTQRQRALGALGELGVAEAFPIPQESSSLRLLADHARSVLHQVAYTRWTYESHEARSTLTDWIRRHDFSIVHVDSLDLLAYLPALPSVPVVLAHHNVESVLLRRRAEPEGRVRRAYIRHQANLVKQAEQDWCDRVDLNIVVSEADAAELHQISPGARLLVMPNGVDTREFVPTDIEPEGGIVFVGGHSWFPNSDGMRFFANDILPLIRERRPEIRVRWIGKATEKEIANFAGLGVEMLGYVDDIRPIMHEAECVVVPLRVGGGTRLKILDAWAMGKAVVSTTVGCEGLETRHENNIMIADSPSGFARAVLDVLSDDRLRHSLEQGAHLTAVEGYDWDSLGVAFLEQYLGLVSNR